MTIVAAQPGEQRHHGGAERIVDPTPAEIDLARQAVAVANRLDQIVYARVDCVTVDGLPQVMELELIEPALFLPLAPPAAAVPPMPRRASPASRIFRLRS